MNIRERKEKAKDVDFVNLLSELGYNGKEKRGGRVWYLSPLHTEGVPSFIINLNKNTWRDWGLGIGGDTIDFIMNHETCSFMEAIDFILGDNIKTVPRDKNITSFKESGIDVIDVREITNKYLLTYAASRAINEDTLRAHCKEVDFVFKGWEHIVNTAIGFKNIKGGWELRSPSKKVGTSPKSWSMIRGESSASCDVFEGFFDFLSHLQWHGLIKPESDSFILNSTVFSEWVKPELEEYSTIGLYMDNDVAAQDKIDEFFSDGKYIDGRALYSNFGDYNEFVKDRLLTEK